METFLEDFLKQREGRVLFKVDNPQYRTHSTILKKFYTVQIHSFKPTEQH